MDRPGIAPPPCEGGGGLIFWKSISRGRGTFCVKRGGLIKGETLRRDWKEILKNFYLFAKMTPKSPFSSKNWLLRPIF